MYDDFSIWKIVLASSLNEQKSPYMSGKFKFSISFQLAWASFEGFQTNSFKSCMNLKSVLMLHELLLCYEETNVVVGVCVVLRVSWYSVGKQKGLSYFPFPSHSTIHDISYRYIYVVRFRSRCTHTNVNDLWLEFMIHILHIRVGIFGFRKISNTFYMRSQRDIPILMCIVVKCMDICTYMWAFARREGEFEAERKKETASLNKLWA